jgi:putative adenylate-forming enzyme
MNMGQTMIAARSFLRCRWLAHTLTTRAAVERHQAKQIAALERHVAQAMPFYAPYRGLPLAEWPVIDKAAMLANFAGMNIAGIDAETVRNALAAGEERAGGFIIGQSTGTSGNRGYYLISDAERFVWLGTILAKTLPDALWTRHRVALALPGLSSLYRSANSASRITLGFFDLAAPIAEWAEALVAFAPDTIVAPPKVLRWLAERDMLHAAHIFSGAEVLDPLDRAVIEGATGRRMREIYMATEGLFGVSCAHGTLHLAEDVVKCEFELAAPGSALQSLIVTDFTRRSMALARYRMNDLVELADEPCACGSPYQAVRRIEGRSDDIFRLAAADGSPRMVTPDVLRNAVVDSHPAIRDFRIDQTGPSTIRVALEPGVPDTVDALVAERLRASLARFEVTPQIEVIRGIEPVFDRKLRRVRRLWSEP